MYMHSLAACSFNAAAEGPGKAAALSWKHGNEGQGAGGKKKVGVMGAGIHGGM